MNFSSNLNMMLAYLDPGTGSFMLQIMIAGLLSGLYAVGQYWRGFKAVILRTHRNDG